MSTRQRRRWPAIFLGFALFSAGFLMGVWGEPFAEARESTLDQYTTLDTFAQVLAQIEKTYVEDVDQRTLVYGAIKGMVRSLDPHSSFLTPEELSSLRDRTEGNYVGVGIEVGFRNDALTIIAPIPGGSAIEQGIQSGDVIMAIDGVTVETSSLEDAVRSMRGAEGSEVTLTVLREGEEDPLEFRLTRRRIELESVAHLMLESGYGYIAVRSFTRDVSDEVRVAYQDLTAQNGGDEPRGLILDLRNNPGGLLREAVRLTDAFISTGLIVSTEGRAGFELARHDASLGSTFIDAPVVVLVNEGSASASEIVAGALQDHKRAVIVGTQTFGKGSVQNIYDLDDGSGMKLTIARYYTPAHRSIQGEGIAPDIIAENVEIPAAADDKPVMRERDLPNALPGQEEDGDADGDAEADSSDADRATLLKQLPVRTALDQLKAHQILNQR